MRLASILALTILATPAILWGQIPASPYAINTQATGQNPPSPAESTSRITVPDGFHVTLFAGEPDVHQPIAFDFDDRGRLWVVECYTYEGGEYDLQKRDRIVIFEDTDLDGEFDKRDVFWDKGQRLTGITLGFGGVWLTSAPHLLFLPDRDADDLPDGPPQVKLDGFSTRARHNMVNGLRWGPDGWLYGRHGITDTSMVGTPETPMGQRVKLNCSIWRYHPQKKRFEVLTNGTTNPWGLDYDDHGEWFFTNNVINHLWHMIPGAHYERMFGDDFNPHLYRLISPTADHYHWDTLGESGTAANVNRKKYDGRHDTYGGGHSHAGGMIYLGGAWPDRYRNAIFMCNTHGRRVNMDILSRSGNSYVASHAADFLSANDDWFRGVELKYGPDGNVYLTDWSDLGECHDRDGVHRTSGRIYKISHESSNGQRVDLASKSASELVTLQSHQNDWFVRHSRRRLQELATTGVDLSSEADLLKKEFQHHSDVRRKLRFLWALHAVGETSQAWLLNQLNDPQEHIRAWIVRLLVDTPTVPPVVVQALARLAADESSGLVRLYLASALQRVPDESVWKIAQPLALAKNDTNDRVQPLMLWYGIERAVLSKPDRALALAKTTSIAILKQHIARRITQQIDVIPGQTSEIIELACRTDRKSAVDYLRGMSEALRGRQRVKSQPRWIASLREMKVENDATLAELARELCVVLGDGRALDELVAVAINGSADPTSRRDALRIVLANEPADLESILLRLKSDRVVGADAIRGLARFDDPNISKQLLRMLATAKHEQRPAIIQTLAAWPESAEGLLAALASGKIERSEISAATASMIADFNIPELTNHLEEVWGSVHSTSAEKAALIDRYRSQLTKERIEAANLSAGRQTFHKVCGSCHRLFGQGKSIGPDLTGSNRDSVEYLLDNIVDPSRVVPSGLLQSQLLLDDGRLITGTIARQESSSLTVQTATEELRIPRTSIEKIKPLKTSLMPEGLLTQLSDEQVRDLIAYLQTSSQVEISE